jgi:hypothetical protein
MTEFEKLVAHLKNLQSKKIKQVTFDVNWLAQALNIAPPVSPAPKPPAINRSSDVDGGSFQEDNDR